MKQNLKIQKQLNAKRKIVQNEKSTQNDIHHDKIK